MGADSTRSQAVLTAIRLAVGAVAFAGLLTTMADADLWGHLLFGRDILQLQGLPSRDAYSFTSDIPWTNHEWLAEVLSWASYSLGGSAGLVALKSGLAFVAIGLVVVALRPIAADAVVHDLLIFLAIAASYGRLVTLRPQVFSLVLFPALLVALLAAERGRPRALILVPFIFALWANLHGGWIVGLAAFGIWTIWAWLQSERFGLGRSWIAAAAFAAVAATLLNPYGLGLWDFLHTTVGVSRDIVDWQPLYALPVPLVAPWIALSVLTGLTIYLERHRINPSHAAIVVMCWAASIRINRLDAFFALAAVVLLGPAMHAAFRRVARDEPQSVAVRPLRPGPAILAALIVLIGGGLGNRSAFTCVPVDEQWAPEPAAVPHVKRAGLRGNMLTFFDWGEYALWHLSPDVKVSMDGRRETIYSDNVIAEHFAIYRNAPDAIELVTKLDPAYVWLPRRLSVVESLERSGWHRIFSGPKSVILARAAAPALASTGETPRAPRCFPGP